MYLEQNIKGICDRFGLDFDLFLNDLEVDSVHELTILDLEAIAEEYDTDLYALIFDHSFKSHALKEKIEKIKLLVIDVDGVMTDGGMYFTESGDQMKKFNTKDGMAIIALTKSDFQVAIISSGFKGEAVKARAGMLGIQFCYVGRDPKIDILDKHLAALGLAYENVAIIGDDINDLSIMRKVGFSACPSDSVNEVKKVCDVVLTTKGGQACVRELIDNYLLDKPLTK
ncbi:MAG: KdsC family phosphatase [Crocinitomicaceae bacterium]